MTWRLGPEGGENQLTDPDEFTPQEQKIIRSERASSGRLNVEVIAVKGEYILTWNILSAAELAVIEGEYAREGFLSFLFPGGAKTVWFRSLEKEMLNESPAYYGPVTAVLEER